MSRSVNRKRLFRHSTLQSPRSIRLVKLLPPTSSEQKQLAVQLIEVDLDKPFPNDATYEALSYTWGARHGSNPILCDGQRLLITPNCEIALQHLRYENAVRVLWIDSICINQTETKEGFADRAIQVPLMGEIYARAQRTLCWLGAGLEYTDSVIHYLDKIGDCPSQRGLDKLMRFEDHIFCHEWHSRIWTVQEVAFATDCRIVCGKSSISWERYSSAANFLVYDQFLESLDVQSAKSMVSIDMRGVLRGYLSGQHTSLQNPGDEAQQDLHMRRVTFLMSCLTDASKLRATNPRDKIYGLYAVYTKLGVPLPSVEYGGTVGHVYMDATVALISWSNSLNILGDACGVHRNPDLPSWVPDWNDSDTRLYMPTATATRGSRIKDLKPFILSPTAGRLCVRGKVAGQVVNLDNEMTLLRFPTRSQSVNLSILSDSVSGPVEDVDFLRLLVDQVRFFRELRRFLKSHQHMCYDQTEPDMLMDILTLGSTSVNDDLFESWIDILDYPHGQYDQCHGRAMAETWKATDKCDKADWTPELMDCATIAASLLANSVRLGVEILSSHGEILDFMKEIVQNMADQAVIAVKTDPSGNSLLLGTTFQSVTAGDTVALLEGADWPMVLRPSGKDWKLIGPAFVFGMMDGEAWSNNSEDVPERLMTFELV